jgi:regulator of replication initiation timing
MDGLLFNGVRILVLILGLGYLAGTMALRAQDPGVQQDAEAAREKLLKASDQIDMIQSNAEATQTAMNGMKADIAKLQAENTSLKQQLADLQAAFEKAEAARVKEQQVLVDSVARMLASGKSSGGVKSSTKKKEKEAPAPASAAVASTPTPTKTPDGETAAVGAAEPPPAAASAPSTAAPPPPAGDGATDASPATPRTQKGYYHIVESGETLTLICSAYRQQGVNVTIAEVQKANGLTDKSVLRVGQKLFIPKPET